MFFSVVIPVYNAENYLRECVDSVLTQTFEDYEIILVDDGSKDSSGTICDEYAQKDARVQVIHKENGGQAQARNIGINAAKGEYLIFSDSDDFFMGNDVFQKYKDALNGEDVLIAKYQKYIEDIGVYKECDYDYIRVAEVKELDKQLLLLVKENSYIATAWGKAIKREIIVKNKLYFDESLSCEDMDWFFNVILYLSNATFLDKVCIAYRQRSGSVTRSLKIKNLKDFIYTLEKWSEFIAKRDVSGDNKQFFFGAMSKYYSNLLIVYSRLKDKNKTKEKKRIKALSFLLDYALSNRPLQIKKVYKLFGFEITILMLKIFDKIKG